MQSERSLATMHFYDESAGKQYAGSLCNSNFPLHFKISVVIIKDAIGAVARDDALL